MSAEALEHRTLTSRRNGMNTHRDDNESRSSADHERIDHDNAVYDRLDSSHHCSTSDGNGKEYLCYFVHRFLAFRHAEVEALSTKLGWQNLHWRLPEGNNSLSPFYWLRLPSDTFAKELASRSLLIKGFLEIIGEGESWESLLENVKIAIQSGRFKHNEHSSWKILVDSCFQTLKQSDQVSYIHKLGGFGFKGKIDLDNPDIIYRLIITSDAPVHGLPEKFMCNRFFFGREVANSNRSMISKYSLPQRVYIGPTSMDTEMAFIMCNMAKVQKGNLVYDPFVGTGSILIAASHLRALTIGADIDIRVIREGKIGSDGQVLDNWANFKQYNLTPPAGLVRMDAHNPAFRIQKEGIFDAIICDPPYGVRAGGRRSLSDKEKTHKKGSERIGGPKGFPPTIGYTLTECLRDLLDFSAKHLVKKGRLVYFLPAVPNTCEGENVPQHPTLKLVSNCEQILTGRYSRRLITMEKVKDFDKAEFVPEIDPEIEGNLNSLSANVYEIREEKALRPKFRSKHT